MRHSYSATRVIDCPPGEVFEVACTPENLFWMKGCLEPQVAEGDGVSPGSILAWRDLLGRETKFEILERGSGRFRIRGCASYGLLEGELSLSAIATDACEVRWTRRDRPEHIVERVLVTLAGPFGKRASIRDAAAELERLERIVRWHRSGREGPPLGEGQEMFGRLIRDAWS